MSDEDKKTRMEVTRIESCECGWHGVKKLLNLETYTDERLACCPKCNAVILIELSKKEYLKRSLEVLTNGSKEEIANFLRKTKQGFSS